MNIPKLKKNIYSFLTKEDGNISKEKIIKAGIIAGMAIALSPEPAEAACPIKLKCDWSNLAASVDHCNELNLRYENFTPITEHKHSFEDMKGICGLALYVAITKDAGLYSLLIQDLLTRHLL